MTDNATKLREKLTFPRILIEVSIEIKLPYSIQFEDELGRCIEVNILYDWKPDLCQHCKGMEHKTEDCRKNRPTRKQWVTKIDDKKKEIQEEKKHDPNDFQVVNKRWRGRNARQKGHPETIITNTFNAL
ncbi:unnamed protein product [Vicia faba]|uniref:DUF4283 domain-containing protein n=1 Tax=Vicia faba TaxID=3906 RepID=A0AAV1A7W5_VICFA|nr:unnamed protein product [Vicia faba]